MAHTYLFIREAGRPSHHYPSPRTLTAESRPVSLDGGLDATNHRHFRTSSSALAGRRTHRRGSVRTVDRCCCRRGRPPSPPGSQRRRRRAGVARGPGLLVHGGPHAAAGVRGGRALHGRRRMELADSRRLLGRVAADCADVAIGDSVELTVREPTAAEQEIALDYETDWPVPRLRAAVRQARPHVGCRWPNPIIPLMAPATIATPTNNASRPTETFESYCPCIVPCGYLPILGNAYISGC